LQPPRLDNNSITMEKTRVDGILPIAKQFGTGLICLTMDDSGMPEDLEGRIKITDDIVNLFKENGIPLEKAYFDHLVRPASTNPGQAKFILDAVSYTKNKYPEAT